MKNSSRFFVVSSLLILIACSSCGVPSSEAEMQAAQQAMDNAKSFHAESLAASNWNDAILAWEQGKAAVEEGKPAKTIFLRAKSRFEKAAAIAKGTGEDISREIAPIQLSIGEDLSKIKADLERGRLSAKVQKQIKPLVSEMDQAKENLDKLMADRDFLKAKVLAKEIQTKLYSARLIITGKKPAV